MQDHAADQIGTELLFENDRVRVWSLTLAPGEASPRHRHLGDYLFVHVTPGRIEAHEGDGAPELSECDTGFVQFTEVGSGIEHYIVNRGAETLREVLVELKGPSQATTPQEPQTNGRSRTVGS